ncbi:hypothetical protein [Acinetobacter sp.]|uniref:hypothetical protein n=1 Tax=Acinetobacter sp. TaxID=472 RepID=UPI002FC812B6
MKNNTLIIILCLIFSNVSHAKTSSQQADSDTFYDLFAGTIIEKDRQLYLHACKSVDAHFKLGFNHAKDEQHIRELMKKHPKFWLNLSANAEMVEGEYLMTVDAIGDEHLNQSCHLTDLLDEL